MASLDNIEAIQKLDEENILGNTQDFPDQIEKCWQSWKKIALPTHFINSKSILILGIGGSGIGAALTASLAERMANIPVITLRDYDIPGWVDKNTLVIGVSYSGDTEETLSAFSQATKKTDKLITISTGGQLASLGSQHKALHYQINYGSQPRAALGYSLTSLLSIMAKLKFLEISEDDISETLILLRGMLKKIDVNVSASHNEAKLLAEKIFGKIPIVIGAGTLSEVARRWKGHFNENAKSAAYFEILPEMNHNALVGLEYPKNLGEEIFVIILESKYDHPRTKLRQQVTTQILQRRRINYETIMLQPSGNIYAEMFQMILLGDFAAYYLAILNNVAPNPVEIINFFRDKLAEVPFEGRNDGKNN